MRLKDLKMQLMFIEKIPCIIRSIRVKDLEEYHKLLSQLTETGEYSEIKSKEQLEIVSQNSRHLIFVIEYKNVLIGCGTVLIEPKFIRNHSMLAHIEDIVIDEKFRKYGLGKKLIEFLNEIAKLYGCYKASLNCSDKNVPFYEKCDFEKTAVQMTHRFISKL